MKDIKIKIEVRATHVARMIALYNAEVIYYRKRMLTHVTKKITDTLDNGFNRYCILVKNYFPKAQPDIIVANFTKPVNFDLVKVDVESIKNYLIETIKDDGTEKNKI